MNKGDSSFRPAYLLLADTQAELAKRFDQLGGMRLHHPAAPNPVGFKQQRVPQCGNLLFYYGSVKLFPLS